MVGTSATTYRGNDRVLFGMILGLLGFWLFAQTMLNIGFQVGADLGVEDSAMTMAISLSSLISGITIVLLGSLADRFGRKLLLNIGIILSIVGSLLIAITPSGPLAFPLLIIGRALQGFSGACIMPSSLALVKAFWHGADRQRAISMWSIGTWGGAGFCSIFAGLMNDSLGWRSIFVLGAVVAGLGMWMIRDLPESRAAQKSSKSKRYDVAGLLIFMVSMIALQQFITRGGEWGWLSVTTISMAAVAILGLWVFYYIEHRVEGPFIDFRLFKNSVFTGATISNFLINTQIGLIMVTLSLMQQAGQFTSTEAGSLTLGYAIAIVGFIRLGEWLLQRFGPRLPMLWACLIIGVAVLLLIPTNIMTDTYSIFSAVAYTLFGVGLAFYATPSTSAALGNLPASQAGTGAGIYKMASSLGAAFGVAISGTVYNAIVRVSEPGNIFETVTGMVEFVGRQDNLTFRRAGMITFAINLIIVVTAYIVVSRTVPKNATDADTEDTDTGSDEGTVK